MAKTTLGSLNFNIVAKTKGFVADLNKAKRKLNAFGRSANSIGKSVGIGLGVPLATIGATSVKTFASFEQSMAKVKAISGATIKEFSELSKSAKLLGATTRFTSSEVAELQLNFSKLGLTPEQINKVTASTLDLALATGEDLAQSAMVGASTMKGFGLEASEMGRITDVMAKSFSSSALDLEKFSVGMRNAQVSGRLAGFSLQETTALLATLVDTGADASKAGTDLRTIFLAMSDKGMTFKEMLDKVNSSANRNATATELVKKRASGALNVLAENAENLGTLTDSFNNSAGSAKEMADIMDNTLQGSFFKLKSAVEAVQIQLGVLNEKFMKPFVDRIASFVSVNRDAIASFMAFVLPLMAVGVALSGLVFIAGQLAFAFANILPMLLSIGGVLAGVFALASLKFIALGVAIGVVVVELVKFIGTFMTAREAMIAGVRTMEVLVFSIKKLGQALVLIVKLFINFVKVTLSIFTPLIRAINGLGEALMGAFTLDPSQIMEGVKAFNKALIDGITLADARKASEKLSKDFIEDGKKLFFGAGKELGESNAEGIVQGTADTIAKLKSTLQNSFLGINPDGKDDNPEGIFSQMKRHGISALQAIGEETKVVGEDMKSIMQNVSDGMTDSIQEFVNTGKLSFRSLVTDILGQLQKLIIQRAIVNPLIGAFTSAIFGGVSNAGASGAGSMGMTDLASSFSLDGMARNGGNLKAGGNYLVGEAGAELFVPRTSGTVIPNHELGGGSGGVTVNFNVQATDANSFDNQLAQRQNMIVGMIDQAFNRQGRHGINA